jgi:hypothetical protein
MPATPGSTPRTPVLLGAAFLGYGVLTTGAWLWAALAARATSPLLLGVAAPCGPIAAVAGVLLLRGSSRARWALAAWVVSLVALNVAAVATLWPDRWPALALASAIAALALLALLRRPRARAASPPESPPPSSSSTSPPGSTSAGDGA